MKVKKLNRKLKITILSALGLCLGLAIWLHIQYDLMYYTYSYDLRRRHFYEIHKLLRPSGLLGHGFGIVGSLLVFIGLIYHIRKTHKKALKWMLKVNTWLLVHMFTSIVGGFLVILHASALFKNITGTATLILFLTTLATGFLMALFKHKAKARKLIYRVHYYSTVLMLIALCVHALYFIYIGFRWIF